MIVFNHRAPSLERAHSEGDSLEVVARMVEHFIRVPVVGQDCVAPVHAQHGIEAVKSRLWAYVTAGPALLAFADNIAFLRLRNLARSLRRGRRSTRFRAHTVS